MADDVQTNQQSQGSTSTPAPAPAQPASAQPAQPVQPVQQTQQPKTDNLGRRILLWTGRIVVGLVYAYCMLGIIVISFRFFLLLFGASPNSSFSNWIYTVSARFMEPFSGMIEITQPNSVSYVDVSALFAITAYAVIAWLVHMLYDWVNHRLWVAEHPRPGV